MDKYQLLDIYSGIYIGCTLEMFQSGTPDQIHERVNNSCYYRLSSENFEKIKLEHNIELAKKMKDMSYLKYLETRYAVGSHESNESQESHESNGSHESHSKAPIEKKLKIQLKRRLSLIIQDKIRQTGDYPDQDLVPLVNHYILRHGLQNNSNRYLVTCDQLLAETLDCQIGDSITIPELFDKLRK